jgi:hypothetical protein
LLPNRFIFPREADVSEAMISHFLAGLHQLFYKLGVAHRMLTQDEKGGPSLIFIQEF